MFNKRKPQNFGARALMHSTVMAKGFVCKNNTQSKTKSKEFYITIDWEAAVQQGSPFSTMDTFKLN